MNIQFDRYMMSVRAVVKTLGRTLGAVALASASLAHDSSVVRRNAPTQKPSPGENFSKALRLAAGATSAGEPYTQVGTHNVGNMRVGHTNLGQFGTGYVGEQIDPVTGEAIPSCEFPAYSRKNHLYVSGLWIGAIVGRDTLVSTGTEDSYSLHEYLPGERGAGDWLYHESIDPASEFLASTAHSEQDIIATYFDTSRNAITGSDAYDGRPHRPINLEIVERSMQWSYEYAADFVLFDMAITNIGFQTLEKVYMGIYVDGDVHHESKTGLDAYGEDMCGFKRDLPAECGFRDTIDIAYVMDNNGDPIGDAWDLSTSVLSAAGVRLVRTPSDSLNYAFNWWSGPPGIDFGPRKAGTPEKPFRDMDSYLGPPYGDRNKYYMMSNGEFDYDHVTLAVDHSSEGWLPPPPQAATFAVGGDPRYLLSFGPFTVFPGETLPITFAYVAGANVKRRPTDFRDLFASAPQNPAPYYATLNFTDLGRNSLWASWLYDNPGVDTDSDGFFGKYRVCVLKDTTVVETILVIDSSGIPYDTTLLIDTVTNALEADTIYYEGDRAPDFRGAAPPPAPIVRVSPALGRLLARWNGFRSETTKDPFSHAVDFEGFRVYTSPTRRRTDFVLQSSYDRENFNRHIYNPENGRYEVIETPFTLAQLKTIYGPQFDPLQFPISNPLYWTPPGATALTIQYFTAQDYNRDELNVSGSIRKRFPLAPKPSDNPDEWTAADTTDEGHPRYYEYEYEIAGLLSGSPLYVSVTAFDFGSPKSGLTSLESSPLANAVLEWPLPDVDEVVDSGLSITVFPNPYRIDGNYREMGFEGRERNDLPDERVRAVHFINLPRVCLISIFSLDGDLLREIEHNYPNTGPGSMHNSWDLVTRNGQPAVSGVYYYTVETPGKPTHIGKLALIM